MELQITEQTEVVELSLADKMERDMTGDFMIIKVKINNINPDEPEVPEVIEDYIREALEAKIQFRSSGVHLLGQKRIPHIHVVYIVDPIKIPQNPSESRKRWCKKNKLDDYTKVFKDISFQFENKIDSGLPKYQVLSYPLKEGNRLDYAGALTYIYKKKPMPEKVIKFLEDIGQAIYEVSCAQNLRNDKCEERKQESYQEFYDFALANRHRFTSFHEMVIIFDEFVDAKPYDKKPCPKNYKSNLQKIGNSLGMFKYSALVF